MLISRGENKSLEQAQQTKLALENKGEPKSQRGSGHGNQEEQEINLLKKHKTIKMKETTQAKEAG